MPSKRDKRVYSETTKRNRREYSKRYHDSGRSLPKQLEKYGLTPETFDDLLFEQNGVCAICHLPDPAKRRLSIDHNHETGEVRGLLCNICNSGLGMFKDDPLRLESAIRYLSKVVDN